MDHSPLKKSRGSKYGPVFQISTVTKALVTWNKMKGSMKGMSMAVPMETCPDKLEQRRNNAGVAGTGDHSKSSSEKGHDTDNPRRELSRTAKLLLFQIDMYVKVSWGSSSLWLIEPSSPSGSVSSAEENVTVFCVILDTGCRSSRIQMSVCIVMMGIWVPLYEELIKLQHYEGLRDVLGIVLKKGTCLALVVMEGDVSEDTGDGVAVAGDVFLIDVCCPWGLHVDVR